MPIEVESPEEMGYNTIKYNLAESSVRDLNWTDLDLNFDELVLFYGEHRGSLALREAIIKPSVQLTSNDVLVTAGAATALFIVATTLLSEHDHLVVIRPNYATNIETPRAIGCEITFVDLVFGNGYNLDFEQIKNVIQPNTKLISLTVPHNPTGKVFDQETILAIIDLATEKGIYVLCDETYRTLNFKSELKPYLAEISPNVISVASLSKAYGVPGIRIGWIICQDQTLMNQFLAAKEQIMICNSVLDEAVALSVFEKENELLTKHHQAIKVNFEIVKNWLNHHPKLAWNEPDAGVVGFVKVKDELAFDASIFHQLLREKHQTIVGPGHWFEQNDRYFRIGFGYPTIEELKQGLANIDLILAEIDLF